MTTVKEVRKTIERMEQLKTCFEKLRVFAVNSDDILVIEEGASLSIPLHMMCDEAREVLEKEIKCLQEAVESAKVDVKLPFFS